MQAFYNLHQTVFVHLFKKNMDTAHVDTGQIDSGRLQQVLATRN